ncbi:MAG: hypothetical protein LC104_20875 [Bacteroidales bacterium]|nr:hypothetical protein [Bacteroidales bacterium]
MPTLRWMCSAALLPAILAVGCKTVHFRAPTEEALPGPHVTPAPELPLIESGSLEPDYQNLPRVDPLTVPIKTTPQQYRRLTEQECQQAAGAIPPPPDPFDTGITSVWWEDVHCENCTVATQAFLEEARGYVDATARNSAVGLALDEFYRLADAEGRARLLRSAMALLDQLRQQTADARSQGIMVPIQPDELDRQRATLVGLLLRAEAGAELLNINLKRRVGVSGQMTESLWPEADFRVSNDTTNIPAAVQTALANRSDLSLLRLIYIRLNPETLPAVEELLRGRRRGDDAEKTADTKAMRTAIKSTLGRHHQTKAAEIDAVARAQVVVMRQRLANLIASRERQVADEVRSAVVLMESHAKQVGLTRWRAEQQAARLSAAKESGTLAVLAAELESVRARADVVEAVMAWHQARTRFDTACGVYRQP